MKEKKTPYFPKHQPHTQKSQGRNTNQLTHTDARPLYLLRKNFISFLISFAFLSLQTCFCSLYLEMKQMDEATFAADKNVKLWNFLFSKKQNEDGIKSILESS